MLPCKKRRKDTCTSSMLLGKIYLNHREQAAVRSHVLTGSHFNSPTIPTWTTKLAACVAHRQQTKKYCNGIPDQLPKDWKWWSTLRAALAFVAMPSPVKQCMKRSSSHCLDSPEHKASKMPPAALQMQWAQYLEHPFAEDTESPWNIPSSLAGKSTHKHYFVSSNICHEGCALLQKSHGCKI